MIYLELFLTFLQVGAVSFGGGYAMISLIREKVLLHGWLTEGELLNMVAVSESTPGPIAVNMATFVGSAQGGIIGSLLATFGVVLPSFIIILLIAAVIRNFLKYNGVQPIPAPTSVSSEQAPQSPSGQITGLRFTGWVLFIFGLVLTQVALLFILFDSDSTVLWISAGVLITIGLELLLIRWKPLFIVMWTVWLLVTVSPILLTRAIFFFFFSPDALFPINWASIFLILWVAYTGFCIGATVGVIRKHIRTKQAKRK